MDSLVSVSPHSAKTVVYRSLWFVLGNLRVVTFLDQGLRRRYCWIISKELIYVRWRHQRENKRSASMSSAILTKRTGTDDACLQACQKEPLNIRNVFVWLIALLVYLIDVMNMNTEDNHRGNSYGNYMKRIQDTRRQHIAGHSRKS